MNQASESIQSDPKSRFLTEWQNRGFCPFYFSPQKDITAWELAQLMEAVLPAGGRSVIYRLEEECFRHLSLDNSLLDEVQDETLARKSSPLRHLYPETAKSNPLIRLGITNWWIRLFLYCGLGCLSIWGVFELAVVIQQVINLLGPKGSER